MEYWNIRQIYKGSNQPGLNTTLIKQFNIALPPLSEQYRIVSKINELLSETKAAKESIDKIHPIIKKFRQSVLTAAFKGELTEQLPSDETTETLLERIRRDLRSGHSHPTNDIKPRDYFNDDIAELPRRWIYTSLESVCYKVENGATPLRSNPENFEPNGIPLIKVENILKNGTVILSADQLRISNKMHKKQSRSIVFPNDVLMNIVGPPLGKIGLVPPEIKEANINQAIVLMRTVHSYDPKILFYCLMSPFYYNFMIKMSKGVRQSNIRKSDVGRIPIPLIPVEEQKRIISKIDELFSLADQIEKHVEEAKSRVDKIDASILTKALHGELVPQDPNDEPVSIPLERIKSERKKRSGVTKFNEFHDNLKQMTLN